MVLKEGLGIGDYPGAPRVEGHSAPPPKKETVVDVATHQEYTAQGALEAPSRDRGYPRDPPIRRPSRLPPAPVQEHGGIPIGVAVESSTPVSPNLDHSTHRLAEVGVSVDTSDFRDDDHHVGAHQFVSGGISRHPPGVGDSSI